MSADILSLYQDVILEHSKRPRNRRALAGGRQASGSNPICGDRITVSILVDGDVIADAAFEGTGCAIFTASASLMTEAVKGRTLAEADRLCEQLLALVSSAPDAPVDAASPLSALAGVRQFPLRVRCAVLPWQTLRAAARGREGIVSTE